jgi:signal transduction histidine kinase
VGGFKPTSTLHCYSIWQHSCWECSQGAVFDAAQQRSIGFVLDISDRKQAEAASVLEERNRIAREIHDTLTQAFTSIAVHLDVASRKLAIDPIVAQGCIQTSYDWSEQGRSDCRNSGRERTVKSY